MGQGLASRLTGLSFDNAKFNNRLAYLINSISVLILIFCGVHYIVKNWFTVNKIIIEGNIKHITPVQLSYIAHNKLHGTFFTLDISGLKAEFQEIPWVRQVSLKRHFPHTIVVKIQEYNALARIGDDDLLAENGEVFDGADDSVNLPIFYVEPERAGIALDKYKQIQGVLQKHNASLVKLWLNPPQLTRFVTNQNLMVTICDDDISHKLAILDQYWDKLYKLNPGLASVNFCYKNALAINSITVPTQLNNNKMKAESK